MIYPAIAITAASLITIARPDIVLFHLLQLKQKYVFSPTFKWLDFNKNGEIDRFEWQSAWLETDIYYSQGYKRESVDCNQDGVINWSEYRRSIIQARSCTKIKAGTITSIVKPENSYSSTFPLIFTARQFNLVLREYSQSVHEIIRATLNSYPKEVSERDFTSAEFNLMDFECTNAGNILVSIELFSMAKNSNYSNYSCEIANNNPKKSVSSLVISVSLIIDGEARTAIHANPVYIPPLSMGSLHIIFPAEDKITGVSLLSTRG